MKYLNPEPCYGQPPTLTLNASFEAVAPVSSRVDAVSVLTFVHGISIVHVNVNWNIP